MITFNPPEKYRSNAYALAVKLCDLDEIGFCPGCPPYQKENGTWVLNSSNDWWLRMNMDRSDGACELDYRYGYGWPEERWEAIKAKVEALFLE